LGRSCFGGSVGVIDDDVSGFDFYLLASVVVDLVVVDLVGLVYLRRCYYRFQYHY